MKILQKNCATYPYSIYRRRGQRVSLFFILNSGAHLQENNNQYTEYFIKVGDTLYAILAISLAPF